MPPREWNATSYERVSAPQEQWGRDVLDRLDLDGDERVLDAGCGTGRVTAALVERLPRGEVVAVDGSPAMVDAGQGAPRRRAPTSFAADLLELELEPPVDAILSTATFHWIADHDRLFARLHAALKPGGRLVAQCGGAGNVANVRRDRRASTIPRCAGWPGRGTSPRTAPTAERLRRRGLHRRVDVASAVARSPPTIRTSTSRPSCSARTSSAARRPRRVRRRRARRVGRPLSSTTCA